MAVASLPLADWAAAVPSSASWMYKRPGFGETEKERNESLAGKYSFHFSIHFTFDYLILLTAAKLKLYLIFVLVLFGRTPSYHIH